MGGKEEMIDLTNDIREMMAQKDMSIREVKSIITDMLKSAYKRKFGTDENAEVKFYTSNKDKSRILVEMLSKKTVVEEEDYFREVTEIPLDEAIELAGDEGDMLDEQLFNFVQTDWAFGIQDREVQLAINVLNNTRPRNYLSLNNELKFKFWISLGHGNADNYNEIVEKYNPWKDENM